RAEAEAAASGEYNPLLGEQGAADGDGAGLSANPFLDADEANDGDDEVPALEEVASLDEAEQTPA
ncbi:MAG: hypothetical protein ACR2HR_09345, partial [Euzebya sp.]